METLGAIAILAAVVGGYLLFQRAVGAVTTGVNRTVQRKNVATAEDLLQRTVIWTVPPGVSQTRVLGAIAKELNAYDSPHLLTPRVYLTHPSADSLGLVYGKKFATIWVVGVMTATTEENGVQVLVAPIEASTAHGVVPGMSELRSAHARIELAVKKLGAASGASAT